MKKGNITILCCFIAVLIFTCLAQDSINQRITNNFGDYKPYEYFFNKMQKVFRENDSIQIANLMKFPLNFNSKKKIIKIKNKIEFYKKYNLIITMDLKKAVLNQKYDSLFLNYNGIMVGKGQIWFSGICREMACDTDQIKIITINNAEGL